MITQRDQPLNTHARLLLQLSRIHAGLTVKEAARRSGYGATKWKHVETGHLSPDKEMLGRMAEVVDLELTVAAGILTLRRR